MTEYMFIYKSEDVQSIQHINVDVRQTMVDVLEKCLENTGLSFLFKENVIIIQKDYRSREEREPDYG
ncbi:MAG: STN domain-containing protein [Butyricimonas faecihominis]